MKTNANETTASVLNMNFLLLTIRSNQTPYENNVRMNWEKTYANLQQYGIFLIRDVRVV